MNFLDKLVIPQSAHHMVLLKYLLVLTFLLFIPYVSVLFGSFTLSLFFKRKAVKTGEQKFLKFAKDLIDLVTVNKVIAFGLGFIPLLSSALCYAQLLHLSGGASVPDYILIALFFFIIAIILIYTYKYSFHLKDIFDTAADRLNTASQPKTNDNDSDLFEEELNSYSYNAARIIEKAGIYGWIFLLIAVYLFFAANQLAADTMKWSNSGNIFSMLFWIDTITYSIQLIAGSFAITASFFLYKYFRPNNENINPDETYLGLIKQKVLRIGLVSTILMPAAVVFNVISKSSLTYSYSFFGITSIVLLLLLLIGNLYYAMLKESHTRYGTSIIYLFIVVVALLIIKDQYAFDTATKKQYAVLAANFETYSEKLNEQIGGAAPVAISGEDIYKNICSACHRFDKRLVGPPYEQTLPKYEGKMDQLVKFILNPVKKNPDYPAMPNQGLKPAEAEAVAKYIMDTYKKK